MVTVNTGEVLEYTYTVVDTADNERVFGPFSVTVQAGDTTAPVLSKFEITTTIDEVTITARAEEAAASSDLYLVWTVDNAQSYGVNDGNLIAQGLLADGVTNAALASGPFTLPSETDVDVSEDISSLSDGTVRVYATAVDPPGNYSEPVDASFTRDPPLTLFDDPFTAQDGALEDRDGWSLLFRDSVTTTVGSGVLTLNATKAGAGVTHYTDEAVSSEDQFVEFEVNAINTSEGRVELALRVTPESLPNARTDFSGYLCSVNLDGTFATFFRRIDNGSATTLATEGNIGASNGDLIRFRATNVAGDTLLEVLRNGTVIYSHTETANTYPNTGKAVLSYTAFNAGSFSIDNFKFGNV